MMIYQGSCHCGHIAFEVEGDLHAVKECNCSICSRLGALRWFVPLSQVRFTTPESNLSTYQFGAHKVKHHFCSKCGCAPLGVALYQDVKMASINARCLEGVNLSKIKISPYDGRSV